MGILLGIFAAFTIIGIVVTIGVTSFIMSKVMSIFKGRNNRYRGKCINNYIHKRRF